MADGRNVMLSRERYIEITQLRIEVFIDPCQGTLGQNFVRNCPPRIT
jgi:hypothetical protein